MPDNWYNSYTKIRTFALALVQAKILETPDEVIDYLNRPSEYDEAYQYWDELGSPGPKDPEWKTWVASLTVSVEEE